MDEKIHLKQISPIKNSMAGAFGGCCLVIVGHPMDTIKVRLQTQHLFHPGQTEFYKGTWDCFLKTVKNEGVRGLYRGMTTPILGVPCIFALSFFGFSLGKRLMATQFPDEDLPMHHLLVAGSLSGVMTALVVTPGDRIKCLLQVQEREAAAARFKGPFDCGFKLLKEGGIRNIYRGACATLLRDCPARATYFTTYETTKKALSKRTGNTGFSPPETMFAGAFAGILTWLVALPMDVMKSRLQTAPEGLYTKGVRQIFPLILKEEGIRGFYRGLVPVMFRAIPGNAACFMGFEAAIRFLNWAAPSL